MLRKDAGLLSFIFEYAPFILPSVVFAAYGIWKKDYLAVSVAYAALLLFFVYYLGAGRKRLRPLASALLKYQNALQEKQQ